jgi:hypothetical protein
VAVLLLLLLSSFSLAIKMDLTGQREASTRIYYRDFSGSEDEWQRKNDPTWHPSDEDSVSEVSSSSDDSADFVMPFSNTAGTPVVLGFTSDEESSEEHHVRFSGENEVRSFDGAAAPREVGDHPSSDEEVALAGGLDDADFLPLGESEEEEGVFAQDDDFLPPDEEEGALSKDIVAEEQDAPVDSDQDIAMSGGDDEEEMSLEDEEVAAPAPVVVAAPVPVVVAAPAPVVVAAPAPVLADASQPEPETISGRIASVLKMSPTSMTRKEINASLAASYPAWWAANAKKHSISAAITNNLGKKFEMAAWDDVQWISLGN